MLARAAFGENGTRKKAATRTIRGSGLGVNGANCSGAKSTVRSAAELGVAPKAASE